MKNPKREYFQRLEMTINEKREILFPVKIVSENKTENSELLTGGEETEYNARRRTPRRYFARRIYNP